jgi:SanA protein
MNAALITAGVPSCEIGVDGRAARTIDSIDHVALYHCDEPVVFVSQAFHLPRVLYLARDRGLDAWGLAASGRLRGLRPRLRETLARLRAIIDLRTRRRSSPPPRKQTHRPTNHQ